jgi:hypothetical protein
MARPCGAPLAGAGGGYGGWSVAGDRQHAVGVAGRVGVEADQVAVVVDAVDDRGADAVRVIDGGEPCPGRQVKPCMTALLPLPTV